MTLLYWPYFSKHVCLTWPDKEATFSKSMITILCSSGSNAQGKSRTLKGHGVSLKKPFKGLRQTWRSYWEERKIALFPWRGSLNYPPGKSMIFYLSGPPNIWLIRPPWPLRLHLLSQHRLIFKSKLQKVWAIKVVSCFVFQGIHSQSVNGNNTYF